MSAASIAAEVEGVGGQPASAQTIHNTLHQIGLHGCCPRKKPILKMMMMIIDYDGIFYFLRPCRTLLRSIYIYIYIYIYI